MPRSAMMVPFLLLSAGPALSQAVTGDAAAALLYPPSPAEVEINGQGVLPKDQAKMLAMVAKDQPYYAAIAISPG